MTTFRSRISNALGAFVAALKPTNTAESADPSGSVGGDAASTLASAWGTNYTGRGTDGAAFPMRSVQDMKPMERRISITRSRFMLNRTGLGRALIEGSGRYSIGSGLTSYSATGDPEFDSSCDRVLDGIFEASEDNTRIDFAGQLNWYEMQEVIAPAMMTDGDCGVAKILGRDLNNRIVGEPKLQMFATEQISDGTTATWNSFGSGVGWREGVLRDEFQRVQKYRILREPAPGYPNTLGGLAMGKYAEFEARDFMLVLDPKRIGIGRGLPWTHHGQPSAITMMDLKTLEESAAYVNAFFGAVITTPDGEIPEGFETEIFRNRAKKVNQKKGTGTNDSELMRKYANFMGGSLIPVLKEGERLQMVKSERPSLTFTGFMDWLVNDIAWGFGIPPMWVWAISGRTGPETRLTLGQADWFFRFIMRRMISRFGKPSRDFAIRWGLLTGRINNGRPPRNGNSPFLARWHGPRKITIDERYFFKTWLERLDKGLGTEEEFYAELGLEASDVRRARVLEVKDWLELCKEHNVPYELVRAMTPGAPSGINAADLAEQLQSHQQQAAGE